MVALGISLANECVHCAYLHTAKGKDVAFKDLQHFYRTRDPHAAFPIVDGQDSLNHRLASWSIDHRNREDQEYTMPCTVR